ncbi:chondroitinase family polysaccharide lyase [Hwangdonia lutea]|uniref:Chondroitinase family polysaccharide lyase n=1 Tax=Hwangdonia lutea TaxID=3075823 RepID=A0AA97EKN7_9FLAO|nr:chondroitinase family polysaccharide lyase [Hwangdonia sp. SCSIO 19198]WOD42877.1 chondroitinase family polysaccharide lyase [Hwangdonia sp. SCSIO 19198]
MTFNPFKIQNHILLSILLLMISSLVEAQNSELPAVESFEEASILTKFNKTNSSLTISDSHYRYGRNSLKWEWQGEASFGTPNFRELSHAESPLRYGSHFPASPTLHMSIYNEMAQNETITISYETQGETQVYFSIPLNFTGWRRIWVPFYEMNGNPPKKGSAVDYDYFKVSTTAAKGTLFFDDIIFSQYQDDRHQYPDLIVPFIKANDNPGKDHWLPLISNFKQIQNLKPRPVSMAIRMDLKKFEKMIDADMVIDKKYKVYINALTEMFDKLQLKDNGTTVLGPPLNFNDGQEYFNKKKQGPRIFNDIKDLGKVMKKLANFHDRANDSERQEIERMFLLGTKYYLDQGWQAGSNGGTRHHIGYNVREITEGFFKMRRFLFEHDLLKQVASSLHWLYNLGMVLGKEENFHVNIDYLNTQAYYHLMLIFMFEEQEMQAEMLRAYSNYLSITLAQQEEEWGFKIDGTAWHHNGHYPAYGYGAFQNVPKIIYTLSKTRFRVGTEGHRNFKNAFLATRTYSQKYDWGFGNAGRHPLEANNIKKFRQQYLHMALAGNPEGTAEIDKEVAAAYLRLWGDEDMLNTSLFTSLHGIKKENLIGYYTFPYAATAVQRQNNWAAIIKGYSKYVWASEIYIDENRYGRYPANGTVQLLSEKGEKGSGFRQEGWDWNRYPGATIIYLPLKELEAKMPLIMFRSNETFAGATKLGDNGIFGMVLNEGKGSNADGPETKVGYPGKLYAKKSVFSFGKKLICIGTNISSIDDKNPTQTNIFQSFLEDKKVPIYTSSEKITKFPYTATIASEGASKNWITDPYGNGYYMLSGNPIQFKKEKQQSYHNKYSINTGKNNKKAKGVKETEGDYASAWINHGMGPKDASYQYVIYPFLSEPELKNFGKTASKDNSYEILRADEKAHIVLDKDTKTTGYVIFEVDTKLEHGALRTTSKPALVMAREDSANRLTLSVVEPDLNFKQIRQNKFENYSRPVTLTLTLSGKWDTAISGTVKAVDHTGSVTTITLECVHGLPNEFSLLKL